jgi:D-lactate dehydrogenase (cytochrome)
MEMPAGIAATLDSLAADVGSCATIAGGVLDQHGRSDSLHAPRSPGVVVCPGTTQDVQPSADLRA